MDNIQLAQGSVIGRDHCRDRRNGQDAYHVIHEENLIVAFVADGCGDTKDSPHSEVGAKIGVRIVTQTTANLARKMLSRNSSAIADPKFWERIRADSLAQLRILALEMGTSLSEIVAKYFLFTLVGAVITPEISVFVSLGDGLIMVNGEMQKIEPLPGNMPIYLAYGLVETSLTQTDPTALHFVLQRVIPTQELYTFLVGTDGVNELIIRAEEYLPGKDELVGSIEQVWTDDLFYTNPVALSRRLKLIAQDVQRIDWNGQQVYNYPGLLHDDTTLIVGRVNPEEQ